MRHLVHIYEPSSTLWSSCFSECWSHCVLAGYFRCANGQCISSVECGVSECDDNSDELNCGEFRPPRLCTPFGTSYTEHKLNLLLRLWVSWDNWINPQQSCIYAQRILPMDTPSSTRIPSQIGGGSNLVFPYLHPFLQSSVVCLPFAVQHTGHWAQQWLCGGVLWWVNTRNQYSACCPVWQPESYYCPPRSLLLLKQHHLCAIHQWWSPAGNWIWLHLDLWWVTAGWWDLMLCAAS